MNKLLFIIMLCMGLSESHASFFKRDHSKAIVVSCDQHLISQKEQAFQEILDPLKAINVKKYQQLSSRKLYQYPDIYDSDLRALIPFKEVLGQGLAIPDIESNLRLLIEVLKRPRLKISRNKNIDLPFSFLSQRLLSRSFPMWSPFVRKDLLSELVELIVRKEIIVIRQNREADGEEVLYGKIFFDHLEVLLSRLGLDHYLFTSPEVRSFLFQSRASLRLIRMKDKLPIFWLEEFDKEWSTLAQIPQLTLGNIKAVYDYRVSNQFVVCGACPEMTPGHMQAIQRFVSGNYKKTRIVVIDGKLIGSLKLIGDRSFLALSNVFNSEGQQVLAAGMAYQLERHTFESINKITSNGVANYPSDKEFLVRPMITIETEIAKRGDGFRYLVKHLRDEVLGALSTRI